MALPKVGRPEAGASFVPSHFVLVIDHHDLEFHCCAKFPLISPTLQDPKAYQPMRNLFMI